MSTLLPLLDYQKPNSLGNALTLARNCLTSKRSFEFCSGATDLVPNLKHQQTGPQVLISLSGCTELREVTANSKELIIGSQLTLREVLHHDLIEKHIPALKQAASVAASPQIRTRATIGGNLLVNNRCNYFNQSSFNRLVHDSCYKSGGDVCHVIKNAARGKLPLCRARFVSDTAPLFLLFHAKLELVDPAGTRMVSLREFYTPDGIDRNVLKPAEVLARIHVPLPAPEKVGYQKLRIRNALDFPSVGVATSFRKSPQGNFWGVAVTGIQTHPLFFEYAEKEFTSHEELVQRAVTETVGAANPLKQDFFSPSYRRQVLETYVRRGLAPKAEVLES